MTRTLVGKSLALAVGLVTMSASTFALPSSAQASDARPHVIWSYTFRDNGDQFNPHAERYYLTCTYVGPHGEFKVHAEMGKCAWLKMFSSSEENVIRHRPFAKR